MAAKKPNALAASCRSEILLIFGRPKQDNGVQLHRGGAAANACQPQRFRRQLKIGSSRRITCRGGKRKHSI
jgi:hypothetical protein